MAVPTDAYAGQAAGLSSPSPRWEALTPHDSTNFAFLPKWIAVGATSGSFVAVCRNEDGTDSTATFYAVAGQQVPIRPIRINSTGLTGGMTFIGLK